MFLTTTRISALLIVATFSTSLLAASDSSNVESTTKLISRLLVLTLLLGGALKSFLLARRKSTSSLCVISLGLLFVGWSTTILLQVFSDSESFYRAMIVVVAGLLLLTSSILAIVGLAQYNRNPEYIQGKSQAIWTLVLFLTFIGIAGFGAYTNYSSREEGKIVDSSLNEKEYRFDELNFQFTTPKGKYVELNKELVNEDASFFIMRSKPKVYFTLIAEIAGEGVFTRETLEEIVESNLESVAENVSIVSKESYLVNNMEGTLLFVDADISRQKLHYGYWLYEHKGFVYQLLGWVHRRDRSRLESEFKKLISGFKMLSTERIASIEGKEPFGVYDDKFVNINAANSAWSKWDDLQENYPQAIVGGEIVENSYFNIIPFCHMGERPHDSAVKYALLNEQNISYPADSMKEVEINQENLKGVIVTHNWTEEDVAHQGRFSIINEKNCDFLVSYWTSFEVNKADTEFSKLLQMIHFKRVEEELVEPNQIQNTAKIYNSSGIYYYNSKNYIEAINSFKVAVNKDPQDANYINNLLDSYNQIKDFDAARLFIESNLDKVALNASSYSWFGWIYNKLEENEAAKEYYKTAFEKGYRGNEDLVTYAELLVALDKLEEADKSLSLYADENDNTSIVIKQSEIKRQLGDYDSAMKLVSDAQEGKPLNTELVFEQIYIAKDRGDFKSAIKFADSLIEEGFASAGAYYQRGVAEYSLQWYVQAKKSFDTALSYAPNNENILDYIKSVSSMLGQGDSTSISKVISPVNYPKSKVTDSANEFDKESFDSYFVKRVTAFEYQSGKQLKKTVSRTIKLLTEQGVKRYSTLEVDFDPLYESVYINELVLLDNEGKVTSEADRNDFYVTDSQGNEANTDKTIYLPVANLKTDSIIRLTYTKESLARKTKFPYTKISHSSSRPVLESKIYFFGDANSIAHQENLSAEPVAKDGMLIWSSTLPELYYDEPMQQSALPYLSSVIINNKGESWRVLADEYLESIDDKLVLDKSVKELAKELTKESLSKEDKIGDLIDYIQSNITYKAIEFGVRGRIPNRAHNTIAMRYGDCKDHAVLFAALLESIDIDAKLALVNLSSSVNDNFPSLNQFNHMVVHLPRIANGIYIDTTDKGMNLFNKPPSSLGNSFALVLEEKQSEIKRIPAYSSEDNRFISYREIDVISEEKSYVTERFEMHGYAESGMRNFLKGLEPGKRFDWAKNFMAERNRDVNLLSLEVKNLLNNRLPLTIETKFEITNTELDNGEFLLEDAAIWEYYYLLPSDVVNRRTSFEILYPMVYQSNVKINVANDFVVSNTFSRESNNENSFIESTLEVNNNENSITKRFELIEKKGVYKKEFYKEYRNSLKDSVKELAKVITFKKSAL